MPKNRTAELFLSYSHQDRDIVEAKIISGLQQSRIWWDGGHTRDQQGLEGGDNFPEAIKDAIKNCRGFLFALSRNSIQSAWCRRELTLASRCGKTILPILIEPTDSSEETRNAVLVEIRETLPAEICETQWLDLSGSMRGKEERLPNWLKKNHFDRKRLSPKLVFFLIIIFLVGVLAGIYLPSLFTVLFPPPPVEQTLQSLIEREAQAVLSGDAETIAAIYINNAIVEDADPNGRIWYDAVAYYTQNRINQVYCRAEHNDFEPMVITTNYARVTTSSEGAFGNRTQSDNCAITYNNPRGADIWEFVRDEFGQWRISRFTFNAHRK